MRAIVLVLLTAGLLHAQVPDESPKRLAPDGLVYLTRRISSKSASGILSFEAGREGRVIEELGEKLLIAIDDIRIEIYATDVTNDLDIRDSARADTAKEKLENQKVTAAQAIRTQEKNAAQAKRMEEIQAQAELKKLQDQLAHANSERKSLQEAINASIRRGNDSDNSENRQRRADIETLDETIQELREKLETAKSAVRN